MLKKAHLFILIVVFGITFGAPSVSNQSPKQNTDDESRIVGGRQVDEPSKYPFICSLQHDYGNYRRSKFCAGTIIGNKWVVTAAHCTYDYVQTGTHDDLRVLCGTTKAWKYEDPGVQYMKVKRIIPHPNYDNDTKHNDISLLEIDGEFQFSRNLFPICIAPTSHIPDGRMGIIMGWGAVDPRYGRHGNSSWYLLEANGKAINWEECAKSTRWPVIKSQLCVSDPNSTVCAGDSGGPYTQFVDGYKRDCIVGIVSYGFANCHQMPSVFTRISEFMSFIGENLRK